MKKLDSISATKSHFGYDNSSWNKLSEPQKKQLRELSAEHLAIGKRIADEKKKLAKITGKDGRIKSDDLSKLLGRCPKHEEEYGNKKLKKIWLSSDYKIV